MYFYCRLRQISSGATTCVVFFCLFVVYAGTCYAQSSISVEQQNGNQKTVASSKAATNEKPEEEYFKSIYRNFHESYHLGPGDAHPRSCIHLGVSP